MADKKIYLLLFSLMVFISCSQVYDVSYDYNRDINFRELKTYEWNTISEKQLLDQLTIERLKTAINSNLNSKGMELSSDSPDFLIVLVFGSRRASSRGSRGGRYRYQEGHLSIDFVEPKSDRLIWHGTAKAELDSSYSPEKSDKLIDEVVEKILNNYPPGNY